MSTYFVLNKKDRSGAMQSRPFQLALKETREQELEEAKIKQRNNLKENGLHHSSTSDRFKSIESDQILLPIKINQKEDIALNLTRKSLPARQFSHDQLLKPSKVISEPGNSIKLLQGQSQSRACEIL
jgi:hypothetical protein